LGWSGTITLKVVPLQPLAFADKPIGTDRLVAWICVAAQRLRLMPCSGSMPSCSQVLPMIIGKILSRNVIRPSVGVTPRHQTVRWM